MVLFTSHKTKMPSPVDALPGRDDRPFEVPSRHAVLGTPLEPPFPDGLETAVFALGCFWGAERLFWTIPGVYTTAVGYTGGYTPNPTYEEVCSGRTGHAEAVLVVFDPHQVSYEDLLKVFYEEHDPTQGMRQGNDVGTQYRSAVYVSDDQKGTAERAKASYDSALKNAGHRPITTEITTAGPFFYAEDYHQQYLHKVPNGYCGLQGTGVACSIPAPAAADESSSVELPTTEEEWRARLTPEQYGVLREAGTERAFSGEYVDTDDDGVYRCTACGNELFDSRTKYHSGSGWPSFTKAVAPDAVELIEDRSHGMIRTEVRCARCHSHLGHVFPDGPIEAGGQRYCMNSVAMDLERRSG